MRACRVYRLNQKHRLLLSAPALPKSVPTVPAVQIILSVYRLRRMYRHFEMIFG